MILFIRFWLAGAIVPVGSSFKFVPANSWSKDSPNNKPDMVIDNILRQDVEVTEPAFCEGIKLNVRIQDELTSEAAAKVSVTVMSIRSGRDKVPTSFF